MVPQRSGICPWRAVAVEVRQDVQVLVELEVVCAKVRDLAVEDIEYRLAVAGGEFIVQLSLLQQEVEEGAGGVLPPLVQPHPRHHGAVVRSPHTGDEDRLPRGGHVAVGGPHDHHQGPGQGLQAVLRLPERQHRPGAAHSAAVRVDERDGHDAGRVQPQFRRQAGRYHPRRFPHLLDLVAGQVLVVEVLQSGRREEPFGPSPPHPDAPGIPTCTPWCSCCAPASPWPYGSGNPRGRRPRPCPCRYRACAASATAAWGVRVRG